MSASKELFLSIVKTDLGNEVYNGPISEICRGMKSSILYNSNDYYASLSFIEEPTNILLRDVVYGIFAPKYRGQRYCSPTLSIKIHRQTYLKNVLREEFMDYLRKNLPIHFEMFFWHPELLDLQHAT